MKYRAKITNIISQIRNVKAYSNLYILRDNRDFYIDVNTEEEAELIEELNLTINKATRKYAKLIELTTKENELC